MSLVNESSAGVVSVSDRRRVVAGRALRAGGRVARAEAQVVELDDRSRGCGRPGRRSTGRASARPDVTTFEACSSGVAPPSVTPSYPVPAVAACVIAVLPVLLIEMTSCDGSKAKLFGAVMVEPAVVQVELSSSAMNASLYVRSTKSGYSSERKRKSSVRQFAPAGMARSTLSTVTSKSVSPRTFPPEMSPPAGCPGASRAALPLLRTP